MKIIIVGNNYHYYHSPKRNIGLLIKNYEVLNENYDLLVVLIILNSQWVPVQINNKLVFW